MVALCGHACCTACRHICQQVHAQRASAHDAWHRHRLVTCKCDCMTNIANKQRMRGTQLCMTIRWVSFVPAAGFAQTQLLMRSAQAQLPCLPAHGRRCGSSQAWGLEMTTLHYWRVSPMTTQRPPCSFSWLSLQVWLQLLQVLWYLLLHGMVSTAVECSS